jgi:hypothetical protein
MNEETMQPEKTDWKKEKIVIPLFEIVVYPESRTKFQVDRATGELLLEAMKDENNAHAVALTVKSGTRPQELTGESLYKTGNLFHIAFVQPADDGYVICAEVVQRVKVASLREKDGRLYATYEPVPDIPDKLNSLLALLGIEDGGEFVQKEQLWPAGKGPCKLQPLELNDIEVADEGCRLLLREIDIREYFKRLFLCLLHSRTLPVAKEDANHNALLGA